MTLTQQFALVSVLPLSFLGMVVYLWLKGGRRRQVLLRWTLVLLAAAVWSSSVLRHYTGAAFPASLKFTWGLIGVYAFSLAALGLLLTTIRYMFVPSRSGQETLIVSLALWLAALLLDPAVSLISLPNFLVGGQTIRHFDVWAAVWIASWAVPVVASWMLTQQVNASLPRSLYRNQIRYWLLVITIFFAGGVLASIHQPGQPIWQEIGVLIVIVAALIGTISLIHSQLPDIQVAARQVLYRLSGTLIIFGLTWLALTFVVRSLTNLPAETDPNLVLILIAAVFAALFMLVNRLVNRLTRRIFLPSPAKQEAVLADYANMVGNFPEPESLGLLILRYVQSALRVDDGWLFLAEDGPAGVLVLRPLVTLNGAEPETAVFATDSPFTTYLRQQHAPLSQYDVDALEAFDALPESERTRLTAWQRLLYLPLHAGDSLIGVLALSGKVTGESYEQQDMTQLQALSEQVSPILAQVNNMDSLRRMNDYVFRQNQSLLRDKHYLQELVVLYNQYLTLISPELRRPFAAIDEQIITLQNSAAGETDIQATAVTLSQQVADCKRPIDTLISLAGRVQMHGNFTFQPLHLDDILQRVIRSLDGMAAARRVSIEYDPDTTLPPIFGDPDQIQEAFRHVIHNAIKFNKIGGGVQITSAIHGGDAVVHVSDSGVGIPPERLDNLWQGLPSIYANGSKKRPGMGLALTQFILAAHNGRITAASTYGSGSTFSLYLPLVFDE